MNKRAASKSPKKDAKEHKGAAKEIPTIRPLHLRPWPPRLRDAIVASFDRKPNKKHTTSFLTHPKCDWPPGLVKSAIKSCDKIPVRFMLVDDSGSMSTKDGHKLVKRVGAPIPTVEACSRWDELKQTIKFHAGLAEAAEVPIEFRLLNGADPIICGLKDDDGDNQKFLMTTLEEEPAGQTPLCEHIGVIVENIRSIEKDLRSSGHPAAVTIATDGESTAGDVARALQPL
jgi:hypothetical protein